MELILHHSKNPDLMYGQGNGTGYWAEPIDPRRMVIEVDDFFQASIEMRDWVARNQLGGGNMAKDCGDVILDNRIVARISYNGKVWTPHKDWMEQVEIIA